MLKTFFIKYKRKGICDIVKKLPFYFHVRLSTINFLIAILNFKFYEGNSNVVYKEFTQEGHYVSIKSEFSGHHLIKLTFFHKNGQF